MKAKSIKGKSSDEIREALKQALRNGFKPTLAILFISIKMGRHAVCEILQVVGIDFLAILPAGSVSTVSKAKE